MTVFCHHPLVIIWSSFGLISGASGSNATLPGGKNIFNVDGGQILGSTWEEMGFERLGRKLYPLDRDATFDTIARM